MPLIKLQGLRGLPGLNRLSSTDRNAFLSANKDKLRQATYGTADDFDNIADALYNNQQFINHFGLDTFNKMANGTTAAYELRNNLLKEDIVNKVWNDYLNPFNNDGTRKKVNPAGLNDDDWYKYNEMSTDAKLKVLDSDWFSPNEFKSSWQKHIDEINAKGKVLATSGAGGFMPLGVSMGAPVLSTSTPRNSKDYGGMDAMQDLLKNLGSEEGAKKLAADRNNKIIDKIYNDDLKDKTTKLGDLVSQTYYGDKSIANLSDDQVRKQFKATFGDDSDMVKLGAGQLASHLGTNSMKDFGVDDMRQYLAKYKVYNQYMSPYAAAHAIDNEAKEYLASHQSTGDKISHLGNDILISALSYSADKFNGIAELGRVAMDEISGKPKVWVSDAGDIIDLNKTKHSLDRNGTISFIGGDDKIHHARQMEVSRSALHQMGKNYDGSNDDGILNPQYWSRAEQFGTLNKDEQKRFEKLGSSPYQVAYNPNEDSDLWYEAFKMTSFGLADAGSQLIPFGIGAAGKALSTASKVGSVVSKIGNVINWTGKVLTAESKVGQVIQGTTGALGIAYAYGRGAFQETLAENQTKLQETLNKKAEQELLNSYNNDKGVKNHIDNAIKEEAAKLKQQKLAELKQEGNTGYIEENLDKLIEAQARQNVFSKYAASIADNYKNTPEYAKLQEKAIKGADDAAFTTFAPEAIKYALVNNFGHRKYLYSNPSGATRKVSNVFKGLREITTADGRKRLVTNVSKFLTKKDKLKELGKTIGSQVWGGAWTNGTDDMMTDAAERINSDSYSRYLNSYQNGKPMADTYGLVDGIYSYFMGLNNSMGQETTWNAAAVGGLGSIVTITPHFTNIASLMTKSGRENYKNNYQQRYVRDENGFIEKNEDGTPKIEKLKWKDNWRDRLGFFIQNGVLNTYYGKKQSERDLQNHADFVNSILDDYNDFQDIEHLIASSNAMDEADSEESKKTAKFIHALNSINVLNNLAKDGNDPTTMSSVVTNAKEMLSQLSDSDYDPQRDEVPNDEFTTALISRYYKENQGLSQSRWNNRVAYANLVKNAKKLKEANDAYNAAETELQKIEEKRGEELPFAVRERLKLNHALDSHWRQRLSTMKDKLGDTSTEDEVSNENLIPSVGGVHNARLLSKAYERQKDDLINEKKEAEETQKKAANALKEAQDNLDNNTDDSKTYSLQKKVNDAKAAYDDASMQVSYIDEQLSNTQAKSEKINTALASDAAYSVDREAINSDVEDIQKQIDGLEAKKAAWINDEGKVKKGHNKQVKNVNKQIKDLQEQKESKQKELSNTKEKVLTADEIFNLDPVTRARMMKKENRGLYSKEQQAEIEKLESQLTMKDSDALNKIQDIATLTRRIKTNEDSYNKILSNPEAAAVRFEAERATAAKAAYNLINQKNAEIVSNYIKEMDNNLVAQKDIKEKFVYNLLRQSVSNPDILDVIDKQGLLPQYQKQVQDAKEWSKTTNDLDAVITNLDWSDEQKANARQALTDIEQQSADKDELLKNIESAIDNSQSGQARVDLDTILKGMEDLDYQRDATVTESRKKRKDREEEDKKKIEEKKNEVKQAAQDAADQKAAKDAEAAQKAAEREAAENAALDHIVDSKGANLIPTAEEPENIGTDETYDNDGEDVPLSIADSLRDKDAEEGDVNTGGIWHKTGSKTEKLPFTASMKKTSDGKKIAFTIGKEKGTIKILPKEWNFTDGSIGLSRDKLKDDKNLEGVNSNTPFEASSMEEINGNWYFNGSFLGHQGEYKVAVSNKFNLDEAIDREKSEKEAEAIADGINTDNNNIEVTSDGVEGKSQTIDEQNSTLDNKSKEQHVSANNVSFDNVNTVGEDNINNSENTLSGNAMSEYNGDKLADDGILKHKKGSKPNDPMNRYYNWMKNAGIHLQNIIDEELGQILQRNPHAKVKFMAVNPDGKGTDDSAMQSHLMLVLDYDDSINKGITSIHNSDNGGVITANGKKYLIIGTAGWGKKNNVSKRALYDILYGKDKNGPTGYGLMVLDKAKYFKENPSERYFVSDKYETEIVPQSLIPGYRVRQLETDSNPEYRSISELLADDKRNPYGYDMQSLNWGIQEISKFLIVGTSLDKVMVPKNVDDNSGRAFVLIPASNGKFVPAYLKPLFFNEMKDGSLKTKVQDLLGQVLSPNYQTRLQAVIELSKIFYFDKAEKNGNNILLSPKKPIVSLAKDGKSFKSFTLGETLNPQDFFDAFKEMNPRVNVTARVLQDVNLLEQWDEAGALTTDIAKLGTAGSSYSIYALDSNGNMITNEKPSNTQETTSGNSDFKKNNKTQVIFKESYYVYDSDTDSYSLNGNLITDEATISQLNYNRRVISSHLEPSAKDSKWSTFVLTTGDNPEVVKINNNSKEVRVLSKKEAKDFIDTLKKKQEEEKRKAAAKEELDKQLKNEPYLDPATGQWIYPNKSGNISKPADFDTRKSQLGDKTSSWNYYINDVTREVDGKKYTTGEAGWLSTLQPTLSLAKDAGIITEAEFNSVATINDGKLASTDDLTKIFTKLDKLGIKNPQDLIHFIEQHEGQDINSIYSAITNTIKGLDDVVTEAVNLWNNIPLSLKKKGIGLAAGAEIVKNKVSQLNDVLNKTELTLEDYERIEGILETIYSVLNTLWLLANGGDNSIWAQNTIMNIARTIAQRIGYSNVNSLFDKYAESIRQRANRQRGNREEVVHHDRATGKETYVDGHLSWLKTAVDTTVTSASNDNNKYLEGVNANRSKTAKAVVDFLNGKITEAEFRNIAYKEGMPNWYDDYKDSPETSLVRWKNNGVIMDNPQYNPESSNNGEENQGTESATPYNEALNNISKSGSQIILRSNNGNLFVKETNANDEQKAFIGNKIDSKTATFIPTSWSRVKSLNSLDSVATTKGDYRTASNIREVIPGRMELHDEGGHKYWKVTKKATLILDNYNNNTKQTPITNYHTSQTGTTYFAYVRNSDLVTSSNKSEEPFRADENGAFTINYNWDNLKPILKELKPYVQIDYNGNTINEATGYEIVESGQLKDTDSEHFKGIDRKVKIKLTGNHNRPATPKPQMETMTKEGKAAQEKGNEIQNISEKIHLSNDGKYYIDENGKKRARVTSVIQADEYGESFDENSLWVTPSTNIGTGFDEMVRDLFGGRIIYNTSTGNYEINGTPVNKIYPNVTSEFANKYLSQWSKLKASFEKDGIHILPRDVVAEGTITITDSEGKKHQLDVAGTVDLLGYNNDGEWFLYDMKTIRTDSKPAEQKIAENTDKWRRQLTLYAKFLKDKYGIDIKEMKIIPTEVHYPKPTIGTTYDVSTEKPSLYNGVEGNQLLLNGKEFKDSRPNLIEMQPMEPIGMNIKYEKLGEAERSIAIDKSPTTQTFDTLLNTSKYKIKILMLLRQKFKDAPKDIKQLKEFLRAKDIEVDAIGTSQTDIDAWMKTIRDCRW